MSILDGMTREEALGCVLREHDQKNSGLLVVGGTIYNCPSEIGLCEPCGKCDVSTDCTECWQRAINAHYDALDAAKKPKWVEPQMVGCVVEFCDRHTPELMPGRWSNDESSPEIARTNARRLLEEFARLNGGVPKEDRFYCVRLKDGELEVWPCQYHFVGRIKFATQEAAEEAIRRYPDELRLLAGIDI